MNCFGGNRMFDFKTYETQLCKSIEEVVDGIVQSNLSLNISAKSRAGAELSDYLEDKFVEILKNNGNEYISNPVGSPKGSTKNPWDAKCEFDFMGRNELVWIDFKAFKVSSVDSNPDIGTPKKIIKFIQEGHFYLIFVMVYYDATLDGLEFAKYHGKYTKVYPLKDVNHTFRLNPKPQLQVNIAAEPEYRTREEFVKLLMKKHRESYKRQELALLKKSEDIDKIETDLIKANKKAEIDFSGKSHNLK